MSGRGCVGSMCLCFSSRASSSASRDSTWASRSYQLHPAICLCATLAGVMRAIFFLGRSTNTNWGRADWAGPDGSGVERAGADSRDPAAASASKPPTRFRSTRRKVASADSAGVLASSCWMRSRSCPRRGGPRARFLRLGRCQQGRIGPAEPFALDGQRDRAVGLHAGDGAAERLTRFEFHDVDRQPPFAAPDRVGCDRREGPVPSAWAVAGERSNKKRTRASEATNARRA